MIVVNKLVSEASARKGMGTDTNLLKSPLQNFRWSTGVAHLLSLILGFISALIGLSIGPSIQSLILSPESKLEWVQLYGPHLGKFMEWFAGSSGTTGASLMATLPLFLVVFALLKGSLSFLQWYFWEYLRERISFDLRSLIIFRFLNLHPFLRHTSPQVQQMESNLSGLISQDIKTFGEYLVHFYGGLPREGAQVLFSCVSVFLLSPKFFLIFSLCIFPLSLVLRHFGRKLKRRSRDALTKYAALSEWIQLRFMGMETIKHCRTEAVERQKFLTLSRSLLTDFYRAAQMKARTSPLIEAFAMSSLAVVLMIALFDMEHGELSGSVLMSFFSSLGLLSQSSAKLGRYLNSRREGEAARDRLGELLATFEEGISSLPFVRPRLLISSEVKTSLVCKDLSISYDPQKPVIQDFNYKFYGGRIYAISGPSGAGKSTLVRGLLGLMPLMKGSIAYSCTSKTDMDLPLIYMPQKLGDSDATGETFLTYPFPPSDILKRNASSDPSLLDLLQKPFHECSGGQKQKILLNRLLFLKAPFIIVDEGTSALDAENEKKVLQTFRYLADQGACVIVVAHRQPVVKFSDEVVLLESLALSH